MYSHQTTDLLTIDLPLTAISALCKRYDVAELAVFGSALRNELRADSDIDFYVVFKNDDYGPWMSKFLALEDDLTNLLQRKVDLISKRGIEQSRNWIKRNSILRSARVIYEA